MFGRPQMSRAELNALAQLVKNRTVIEFGSGYSTTFMARHAQSVLSVEGRLAWFRRMRERIHRAGLDNVEIIFAPPESSAYSRDGEELWGTRVPPDYGFPEEFEGHINTCKSALMAHPNSVVLVDGWVRETLAKLALDPSLNNRVLLHDVSEGREYLNSWAWTSPIEANQIADALFEVRLAKGK